MKDYLLAIVFAAALLLVGGREARADDYDDIERLDDQFWSQVDEAEYDAAQRTVDQMMALGRQAWQEDHWPYFVGFFDLVELYLARGEPERAEQVGLQTLEMAESSFGGDSEGYASSLDLMARICFELERHADAERYSTQAMAAADRALGEGNGLSMGFLLQRAFSHAALGRFDDARAGYRAVIAYVEQEDGADSEECLLPLARWSELELQLGNTDEARRLAQRLVDTAAPLGDAYRDLHADGIQCLARCESAEGRYAESDRLAALGLELYEQHFGPDHPELAWALDVLAESKIVLGEFAEAETAARRGLVLRERAYGADDLRLVDSLASLGWVFLYQGRYVEADAVFARQQAIAETGAGPESMPAARALYNRAMTQSNVGRLGEAELMARRALEIDRRVSGPAMIADTLLGLAQIFSSQLRNDEAERAFEESLTMLRDYWGPEHGQTALAEQYYADHLLGAEQYDQAETLLRHALGVQQRTLPPGDPDLAYTKSLLALAVGHRDYEEARPMFAEARAAIERFMGPNYVWLGPDLLGEAELLIELGRDDDAEPLLERAIMLMDRAGALPGVRARAYRVRAQLAWRAGRRSEALSDLRQSMELVENQRGQVGGGERERAQYFGQQSRPFEQMVAWQVELGDASETLAAMERARARSLLDEISRLGTDLDAAQSSLEQQAQQQREQQLQSQVAALERRLQALATSDAADRAARVAALEAELARARQALYEQHRDSRASNPVYRDLLSVNAAPLRLSQIQSRLLGDQGAMLVYFLGDHGGYLLVIEADQASAHPLAIDELQAAALDCEPGPLTAALLHDVLVGEAGVMHSLSRPGQTPESTAALAALWRVLIPDPLGARLVAGQIERLIVVPDGPLALLPLEALVVSQTGGVRYLLDVGPPIAYAPSASILFNLADRPSIAPPAEREPVLTVGNPSYRSPSDAAPAASEPLLASTRYGALGQLPPLPHTATESRWIADVFRQQGQSAVQLVADQATEDNLRAQVAGRRLLHLACHGLTDQAFGNFFGALALSSPPTSAAPADRDGFLTFSEIYELELSGCELAILSACETNYGPQQQGEGTWALSRGFLVAGARRVVASNWLVDDEAAASLVSYFCGSLASADDEPDYASSLQAAKRWARGQPRWQDPYYWATFVLVGPQ